MVATQARPNKHVFRFLLTCGRNKSTRQTTCPTEPLALPKEPCTPLQGDPPPGWEGSWCTLHDHWPSCCGRGFAHLFVLFPMVSRFTTMPGVGARCDVFSALWGDDGSKGPQSSDPVVYGTTMDVSPDRVTGDSTVVPDSARRVHDADGAS